MGIHELSKIALVYKWQFMLYRSTLSSNTFDAPQLVGLHIPKAKAPFSLLFSYCFQFFKIVKTCLFHIFKMHFLKHLRNFVKKIQNNKSHFSCFHHNMLKIFKTRKCYRQKEPSFQQSQK